jgi:hypothetical protein
MSRIEHALVRPQFVPLRRVESVARVPARLRPRGSTAAVDVFEPGLPRSWMEQVATSQAPLTPQPPKGWFAQGSGNACGTKAHSYVLWRLGKGYLPHAQIDEEIRNLNTFSDPSALVDFAEDHGCQAAFYNHGSFDALRSELSHGRQAMVLVDPDDGGNLNTHWMAVTRVGSSPGGQRWVELLDPKTGAVSRSDWAAFDKKWRNVRLDGASTGYDRACLLVDRDGAVRLPPSNSGGVEAVSDAASTFNDLVNGFGFLQQGRLFGGLGRLLGGATALPFTLPGAAMNRLGSLGLRAGGWLGGQAASLWREGGAWGKVAAPFVGLAAGVVAASGWVLEAGGNVLGFVGEGLASFAKGVGDVVDDALGAIGDFFGGIF